MKFQLKEILFVPFFLGFLVSMSQVPKKVIVEHFTNSHCSVCAAQNPGFYNTMQSLPDVLHLAIYPSSPYAACILNQQSQPANDQRTNFYGVYCSTPRFVVQGEVKTSAGAPGSAYFTPYLNQQSPISLRLTQKKYGNDSVYVRVAIKNALSHALSGLTLFVALAEDTLFYTSPNGETQHYDVFRKCLGPAAGNPVVLSSNAGDSLVFESRTVSDPNWNPARIYAMVILQGPDKKVIQAEAVSAKEGVILGLMKSEPMDNLKVWSDHQKQLISVRSEYAVINEFFLFDVCGKIIKEIRTNQNHLDLEISGLSSGLYYFKITTSEGTTRSGKLIVVRN
jgi:hypothetical protein